jgi:SPP1 gp7 family putative phage head morphogenesis protein
MAKDKSKIGSMDAMVKDTISHDVEVVKFEERLAGKSKRELKQLKQKLIKDTAAGYPASVSNPAKKRAGAAQLVKHAKTNIRKTYDSIDKVTNAELGHLAAIEAEFAKGLVNNFSGGELVSKKVKDATLRKMVKDVAIQGAPSADWWSRQSIALQNKFTDRILQAVQGNWTLDQIVESIRGTEASGFTNGIMATSEVQAEALARSSVQTVSNAGRLATMNANQDVIENIQWIATLDGRTSTICQGLNGKKWKIPEYVPVGHGTPFPGPIAHWRCRSTQIPITYSFKDLPKNKQSLVHPAAKASMGETATDAISFLGFLKSLPDKELAVLLGDAKSARRLKAGKVSEAEALRLSSRQPTDAEALKANLKALGVASFDDLSLDTFKGRSLADAEKLIVGSPNEIALILKKNKVTKVITGDTSSVEFDWFTRRDIFDSVVVHNHGAASSFSTADIELFFAHKPKQFRVVMPVNDIQAGFLGASSSARQATIVLEKIDNGPDIPTKDLMQRIKEEREIYFKSILDAGDDITVNETQARFATFLALQKVADDVPGFKARVEFSTGRIGVPETVDDLIEKLNRDRSVTIIEPETVVLDRANRLGLKVDNEATADARVRGILKEMFPDKDSSDFNLEQVGIWNKIRAFTKKNPEAIKLPLNQFEQGATFNSLKYAFTPDIRDKGGPSNTAWIDESMKQVFIKAKVDYAEPTRNLSLSERLKIQNVIDSGEVEDVFEFAKVNRIAADAAYAARTRNELATTKAEARIETRLDKSLANKLEAYREKIRKEKNILRAAKERLQRAKEAKDTSRILIARADIAALETASSILAPSFKTPLIKPKFTPVPRFLNEKHVIADELPDLEQSIRAATGKAKPVREAALTAGDKLRRKYDLAYRDFTSMDVDEFNTLLNKSIQGDILSEHEALVVSRGLAAASSRYAMHPDSFRPKSFEELLIPENKRKLLTNYQKFVMIDPRLKRLRETRIFKKVPVDPITGQAVISPAEEAVLTNTITKLVSKPTTDKKLGKGYTVDGKFIPQNRMDAILELANESIYITGRNRIEPLIQALVPLAAKDYDWSKVKNFRAMVNGTKQVPGMYQNRIFQYADKLGKQWESSKQITQRSTISLARKSEAGVNTVSKDVLVTGPQAVLSTKMSNRINKLIRYHNLDDNELILHELINVQRLKSDGVKDWTTRIRRPQQAELIRKSADGDIVILEPLDLRKKVFKDLSIAIADQRNDTTIAEVNRRIGKMVLDARIYKQLKTNLAGKLDMTVYEDAWEAAKLARKTDMNLFEYGLNEKIKLLGRSHQNDLDKIYTGANNKIDDAYRTSLKSPKRAASLNAIDDQKTIAEAVATQSTATRAREQLVARGQRAARELKLAVPLAEIQASQYGKQLSNALVKTAFQEGSSFDPTKKRLANWIKGSKWEGGELSDRILMSILDADLSQGAMGPMAHQIGSMLAKSAGITGISPEAYMQVGALVIQQVERQKFIKRVKKPLLNKDGDPIRGADGNFKMAWHVEIDNDKLRAAALSEPGLRRFSKLPQSTPAKFDPDRPWEYEDGTSVAKIFDKDILQRIYSDPTSPYRKAIEAKNNTAYTVNRDVLDFYDTLRARGLKRSDGTPIIPSWDMSVDPKSAKGISDRSKTLQWNNIHSAAKAISGEDQLHFKYTSDFRGRSYASGVVHVQGPPQAKSYFRFKSVDKIGNKENVDHFWKDMANRSGDDKLPNTKNSYEDWALVREKYGAKAAKDRMTVQDYGFETMTPKYAKIWDDIQDRTFYRSAKARKWIEDYEDEWPEIFSAAVEINNLRTHVERTTGKKLFKVKPDGTYVYAMPRAEVEKAMLSFKPTLIPHIDGTTNAYQQMALITRDDDLGRISNLGKKQPLYDAYFYTGLTIRESDEAVVAATIKRDNRKLYDKALASVKKAKKDINEVDVFNAVGLHLKANFKDDYDKSKRSVQKALDIKKAAVEAMPEVFGKNPTVNVADLRDLFKKPVMLQPYGASITTILNAIKKEGLKLAKKNPEKYGFLAQGDNAKIMGQAVVEMNPIFYPKAREYQQFLRQLIARHNNGVYNPVTGRYVTGEDGRPVPVPLQYKLPNGVELNLAYKETLEVPVEVVIGKDTGWLTTQIHTDRIKSTKQLSAISANVTHSHDAAWDHLWTLILSNKGVKNFVGIHDAAGTDFGNMDKLHDAWRQAGVQLYQDYDLFENLLKQAREKGVNVEGLKPPRKGTLDIKELLDSQYAIH